MMPTLMMLDRIASTRRLRPAIVALKAPYRSRRRSASMWFGVLLTRRGLVFSYLDRLRFVFRYVLVAEGF